MIKFTTSLLLFIIDSNEYIPPLDRKNRVSIIYPVLNNQPKYNMGIYLGDATHKPAKVCWNGSKLSDI